MTERDGCRQQQQLFHASLRFFPAHSRPISLSHASNGPRSKCQYRSTAKIGLQHDVSVEPGSWTDPRSKWLTEVLSFVHFPHTPLAFRPSFQLFPEANG